MHEHDNCSDIIIRDGWACCKHCGKRLFKVTPCGYEIKCSGKHPDGTRCREVLLIPK